MLVNFNYLKLLFKPHQCNSFLICHLTLMGKEARSNSKKFHWSSMEQKNRICLVDWELVFSNKDLRGQGVRDSQSLNTTLLTKFGKRFISFDWLNVMQKNSFMEEIIYPFLLWGSFHGAPTFETILLKLIHSFK